MKNNLTSHPSPLPSPPSSWDLGAYLISLAEKYETEDFILGDPSWFMHQVSGVENQETMAFIASALSYGSRKQFMPKIQTIMESAQGDVWQWVMDGHFSSLPYHPSPLPSYLFSPDDHSCFYRLYTNATMYHFLSTLQQLFQRHHSLGSYLRQVMGHASQLDAYSALKAISSWFADHQMVNGQCSSPIPKDTTSCCKRLCMFLRWMVRSGSPVDLGLWYDFIDRRTLIIPMDTHVVQQAMRLGLIDSKTTSMSNARKLTERLAGFFPDDPLRGDFALFGYGVNSVTNGQ